MRVERFAVVDGDSHRRAAAAFTLASHAIKAEPYQSADEFTAAPSRVDACLVHHDPGAISAMLDSMGRSNSWRPIIAYAAAPTIDQIVGAINEGADHFVSWPWSLPMIDRALERLSSSNVSTGREKARQHSAATRLGGLTPREREVLLLVSQGLSSRAVGVQLGISHRTVEIHRLNALRALQVESTIEAVRLVFEAGLMSSSATAMQNGMSFN